MRLGGAALQRCDKAAYLHNMSFLSEVKGMAKRRNLLSSPAGMDRVERTLLSAAFDLDFVGGAPSPKMPGLTVEERS